MNKLEIKKYTDGDYPEFKKYIAKAFHEKYILGDPKYIDWQYGGNLYLAKIGKQVVGHFGFKDLDYKIFGETKSVRVLMNLFVSEEYRSAGVAALLAQKVFETQKPVLVSGYRPAATQLFAHLRPYWRENGNLKRYFIVLDAKNKLFSDYSVQGAKIPKITHKFKISATEKFSGDFENFWATIKSRYPATVERDLDYLNWRFGNNPFLKYSVLTLRAKNDLRGYLIWRVEKVDDFRIARLVDLVAAADAEQTIINEFLGLAIKNKISAADFFVSGNFADLSLKSQGFLEVAGTPFENFPSLFNPLSNRKTYINIASDFKADLENFYFTKAEGDQDRANPR